VGVVVEGQVGLVPENLVAVGLDLNLLLTSLFKSGTIIILANERALRASLFEGVVAFFDSL
jgi:hypothetical protein